MITQTPGAHIKAVVQAQRGVSTGTLPVILRLAVIRIQTVVDKQCVDAIIPAAGADAVLLRANGVCREQKRQQLRLRAIPVFEVKLLRRLWRQAPFGIPDQA